MKTLLSGVLTVALVTTVILDGADARGGRGRSGGSVGRPPSGPRSGGGTTAGPARPHPGGNSVRPPVPGPNRPGNLADPSHPADAPRYHVAPTNPRNPYGHLGIAPPADIRSAAAQAASQWRSQPAPFSAAWYAQHPQAWKYTHPHADAFVAATAVGIARWLAVPYAAGPAGGTSTAVVVEQVPADSSYEEVADEAVADQMVDDAQSGDAQWMAIGVFSIQPPGQAEATRILQLAVNHDGVVHGLHYDLVSDEVDNIAGRVDKVDLRVTWSVGTNGKVVFEAPLGELTQPAGTVDVHFPEGRAETWRIRRVEK